MYVCVEKKDNLYFIKSSEVLKLDVSRSEIEIKTLSESGLKDLLNGSLLTHSSSVLLELEKVLTEFKKNKPFRFYFYPFETSVFLFSDIWTFGINLATFGVLMHPQGDIPEGAIQIETGEYQELVSQGLNRIKEFTKI